MVHSCCAIGCTNRATKNSDVTFHSFPSRESDRERFDAWVRAVNRQKPNGSLWMPSVKGHDKLCSAHFTASDYKETTKIKFLKPNAIPSLFSSHQLSTASSTSTPRKPPRKRKVSDTNDCEPSVSQAKYKYKPSDDHGYCYESQQDHIKVLKEKIKSLENDLEECRAENRSLKQKLNRKKCRNTSLLEQMKQNKVLSNEEADFLRSNFNQDTVALIENELLASKSAANTHRYSEILKTFATTVHFYSPQAYNYLRKYFHLPNPATLRDWASKINCEPGFLLDVLRTLGSELSENDEKRDVCIMFDALAIKKELVQDNKKGVIAGLTDFGEFSSEINCEDATEALFFMIVGLKGHWKRPFGYFLGKPSAQLQAKLVRKAISLVTAEGFNVLSVTCDGCFSNQSTAEILGCSLNPDNLKSSFPHPDKQGKEVYFIFDACHLLKCVRNCLGDMKVISVHGNTIKWNFIEALHETQLKDDMHLANKLGAKHINYHKAKMNVRIAAQTLSNSVADAIDFLREDLHLPMFRNSQATTQFIRKVDLAFDLCNSSNAIAKGNKSAVFNNNLHHKSEQMQQLCDYIRELCDVQGKPLIRGRRKTPFVGFLITLQSLKDICNYLLVTSDHPFKFVLTYKFSQDHLEMLFSRLRRRGGWNNNPNAMQLKWALRAVLMRNGITPSTAANCIDITECAETASIFPDVSAAAIQGKSTAAEKYAKLLNISDSNFHDNALFYVAGYVCRKMTKRVKCTKCASELFQLASHIPELDTLESALVRRKDRGGLLASNDFYIIIKSTDHHLRLLLLSSNDPLNSQQVILAKLQIAVCAETRNRVFNNLATHCLECHYLPADDHITQIIKTAVVFFFKLMLKRHVKLLNERNNQISVRHHLNKTILFLHH